ncbi:MAG: PilZ domain-containing protein, partial [Proteobacteria bacterium]|nr:PilZ domain-containing protein [Pseudomonadota bacterium]
MNFCADCLIEILPKTLFYEKPKGKVDKEKRIAQRFPVVAKVHLQSQKKRKLVTQVIIQNISDTGMKLILKEDLFLGETVTIGIFGTHIVYKAVMNVVFINPMNQAETTSFEAGMRLIGVHQTL